jgi:predicted GH43/DUF377 family glycosyl hydrolase
VLEDGLLRTYFTSRDSENRSHIGWVELDPSKDLAVLASSQQPVLGPGTPGLFDDSGTSMGCLVQHGGADYLYYVGWNLRVTVPWANSIGLAIRRTGQSGFEKIGRVPVMDRSESDPYSLSYPCVLVEENKWRMWYGSNLSWGESKGSMHHVIKYAESDDGLEWKRQDIPVLSLGPGEFALSRPVVRNVQGAYEMFYSIRHENESSYQLGFATSEDGRFWTRRDADLGLKKAEHGWDSQMVCYAFPFRNGDVDWLLYNGNDFGRTGFGCAERNRI